MADEKNKDPHHKPAPTTEALAEDGSKRQQGRRKFMQAAALGAVGLTTGVFDPLKAMASASQVQPTSSPEPVGGATQPKFDHLVVLMMENRSFDHMLGRLYLSDNPPLSTSLHVDSRSTASTEQ